MFACHCTECQKQSGSAYGLALWVRLDSMEIQGPQPLRWTRLTPSGKTMHCDFCPACGTRLFHRIEGNDGILSIKPGTLNSRPLPQPVAEVWTDRAHAWARMGQGLQHAGNPDSLEPLFSAWLNRPGK